VSQTRSRSAPQADALDFPVRPGSLRACFTFDLRAPLSRRGLVASWFLNPSFRAVAAFRVAQHLHDRGWATLARWVSFRARALTGAEIHLGARIGPRLRLGHPNGVVIGNGVVIEPDVTILQQVTVGGPGREIRTEGRRYPRIGRGANLYAGAKVIGPIDVGAGASVGANSVVRCDVPPGALAAGVPAEIRMRSRNVGADEDAFE
jgi:serine O-acetyltransferase